MPDNDKDDDEPLPDWDEPWDTSGWIPLGEQWRIAPYEWDEFRPLSPEQLALQQADKMPTGTLVNLRAWLARQSIPEDDFRTHPVYAVLCERYPNLRGL